MIGKIMKTLRRDEPFRPASLAAAALYMGLPMAHVFWTACAHIVSGSVGFSVGQACVGMLNVGSGYAATSDSRYTY